MKSQNNSFPIDQSPQSTESLENTSIKVQVLQKAEDEKNKFIQESEDAAKYQLTELGNAERFADQYKDIVRYVSAWKKWIYYDGKRWNPSADEKIRQLAHVIAKDFFHQAAMETEKAKIESLLRWGQTSSKSSSISALLKEAAALLVIDSNELDRDTFLFNCNNATIDLRTMTVRLHDRKDFITKISPVDYDPNAKAPIFLQVPNPAISPPESGAIRHPIPGKSPPVIGAKRRWFFSSFS